MKAAEAEDLKLLKYLIEQGETVQHPKEMVRADL